MSDRYQGPRSGKVQQWGGERWAVGTELLPSTSRLCVPASRRPWHQAWRRAKGKCYRNLDFSTIDLFLLKQMVGFVLFQERKLRENQVGKNCALNRMHNKGDLVCCGCWRQWLSKGKDNFQNIEQPAQHRNSHTACTVFTYWCGFTAVCRLGVTPAEQQGHLIPEVSRCCRCWVLWRNLWLVLSVSMTPIFQSHCSPTS